MGAEPRLALLAEHLLAQVVERALEVAERDALVHHEALDLRELGQVGRVGHVAAVHLAGRDHVDGQLVVLHRVHLHAGGLGAQQYVGLAAHGRLRAGKVAHIERVGQAAAGVVGRGVQRLEVVVVGLHLGARGHRVAQAEEDLGNLVGDAVDEVARAHLLRATRQRHVHGGRVDGGGQLGCGQLLLARGQRAFDGGAHLVRRLAHGGALLLRDLPHLAQVPGQRARLAQHADAHLLERRGVGRLRDLRDGLLAQRLQFLHDCHSAVPFRLSPRAARPAAHMKKSLLSSLLLRACAQSPRTREGSRGTTSVDGRACARRPLVRSVTGAPGASYLASRGAATRVAPLRPRSNALLGRESSRLLPGSFQPVAPVSAGSRVARRCLRHRM